MCKSLGMVLTEARPLLPVTHTETMGPPLTRRQGGEQRPGQYDRPGIVRRPSGFGEQRHAGGGSSGGALHRAGARASRF